MAIKVVNTIPFPVDSNSPFTKIKRDNIRLGIREII